MTKRLLLSLSLMAMLFPVWGMAPRAVVAKLGSDSGLRQVWTSAGNRMEAWNRQGGGFAITCAGRLVGYSDTGSFDYDNLPPALREMMSRAAYTPAPTNVSLTPVAPLLGEIAWDQNDPYNLLCPVYRGKDRAATGCSATAMAQILRYHCYPPQGEGSVSYISETYPEMGPISVDFTQSHYDWANMTPRYSADSSETERQAVALLMRDAGAAVEMAYGPQSGADNARWPEALTTHFGYDGGVAIRYRANYDIEDWNAVIRSEIEAGRPVYASGFTDAGGHAFVFDGYDASGLLHVNWGWSGMSSGYFDPMWLSPSTQGTGGSAGGFNARQVIVTGIRPAAEGSAPVATLVSEEALTSSPRKGDRDAEFKIRLNGKIENPGWRDVDVTFGLLLTDADGNVKAEYAGADTVTVSKGDAVRNAAMPAVTLPTDLADGIYRLYPVARAEGATGWERVRDKDLSYPNYLVVTVTTEQVCFAEPATASLSTDAPKLQGTLYAGMKTRATAVISNQGGTEYRGAVSLALFNADGKLVVSGESLDVDIMPGADKAVELFASFNVNPGSYRLAVADNLNRPVSDFVEVELHAAPDYGIEAVIAPDFGDNNNVDPAGFTAKATVRSPAGKAYSGQIYLYFLDTAGNVAGCAGPVFAQVDGSARRCDLQFTGALENAQPGTEYDACLVDGENSTYITPRETATTRIRIKNTLSAPSIEGDASATRYYSVTGLRLSTPPASGIYIEIRGGKVSKKVSTTNN